MTAASPVPCPGERCATLGLDGMEPGARRGVREPGAEARGERSPTDLHHDPVERRGGLLGDLPTDGSTAIECEGVLGPLHREGDRAGGDRVTKAEHRRIAGRVVRSAFAAVDRGAEAVEFRAEPVGHPGGDVHVDRPVDGGGERRRGEGSVAARGDCQPGSFGEVPDPLGRQEVEQDRDQVARLLASGHSPGLVLDPHATIGVEAQHVRQLVAPGERGRDESSPRDPPDRSVGLLHQLGAYAQIEPVRVGVRRPREVVVVGDQRRSARRRVSRVRIAV